MTDRPFHLTAEPLRAVAAFDGRVLHVHGSRVYAARGHVLFESDDSGATWRRVARVPVGRTAAIIGNARLASRASRLELEHMVAVSDGRMVLFGFGRTFGYDPSADEMTRGAATEGRPIAVSVDRHGAVYYGAYRYGQVRRNIWRRPICIWRSVDGGRSFQALCALERVLHVHGVFHDPFDDSLWITTGDRDPESAIWRMEAGCDTPVRVVSGSQRTRAIQVLFTEDAIYFGTDTPHERNAIYRLRRRANEPERIAEVGGPVFSACRVGQALVFGTGCEPSGGFVSDLAEVWMSDDGSRWRRALALKKDRWPMHALRFGSVRFPSGTSDNGIVWLSPLAVDGDGQSFGFDTATLRERCARTPQSELPRTGSGMAIRNVPLFIPSKSPCTEDHVSSFYDNVEHEVTSGILTAPQRDRVVGYYRRAGLLRTWRRPFFRHHFARTLAASARLLLSRPGAQILDLGCGFGTQTLLFALLGAEVVALDNDSDALDVVRRRVSLYERCSGRRLAVTAVHADATTFDFTSLAPLDGVHAMFAFNRMPRGDSVLRGLSCAMGASSRIALLDTNWLSWRGRVIGFDGPERWSPPRLAQALECEGFRILSHTGGFSLPPAAWVLGPFQGATALDSRLSVHWRLAQSHHLLATRGEA
jgi:SAM-dependent methyltransferase